MGHKYTIITAPRRFSMRKLLIFSLLLFALILTFRIIKQISGQMLVSNQSSSYPATDKFPITKDHIYQNSRTTYGIEGWINGKVDEQYRPDYTFVNGADGPHEISIRFPQEWDAIPRQVRIYDFNEGQSPITQPTRFFLVRRSDGAEFEIGKFNGKDYGKWIEFNVADSVTPFIADRLVARGYSIFGGSMGACDCYGSEIEIYGDYNKDAKPNFNRKRQPLKYTLGSNGFWWDFAQIDSIGFNAHYEVPAKTNRYSEMGLQTFRFYKTWEDFESGVDTFSFQPTIKGWYTDTVFQICRRRGIDPIMTIMGMPAYLYNTWPEKKGAQYASPVLYADRDKRELPASFARAARLGFIVSGRYGRNASIPDSLMGNYYVHPESWIANDRLQKGLNLVTYLEILNEADAFWGGRYAYMDGYKLGAFLSAIYDGHKRSIDIGFGKGIGIGIKNADPTMMVVITGFAIPSSDALNGIYDWSRKHRGLKADGSVDLPFDIINYHDYSTDAVGQHTTSSTAFPPELSVVTDNARSFVDFSNRLANGREVWLTEWGFDYHDSSMYQAPPIGKHTKYEVIGAWALRTMLLFNSIGIDRLTWFKTFDDDPKDPQFFRTMSLLHQDKPAWTYPRRAVGDYMAQLKQFGDYYFDTLISTSPYVLRYKNNAGSFMYTIWAVEKTVPAKRIKYIPWKGFDRMNTVDFRETTGNYSLQVPANAKVLLHQFVTGTTNMNSSESQVKGNTVSVSYGLRPVIVEVN